MAVVTRRLAIPIRRNFFLTTMRRNQAIFLLLLYSRCPGDDDDDDDSDRLWVIAMVPTISLSWVRRLVASATQKHVSLFFK